MGFTALNVVGLSTAIGCALLLFAYIQCERSYDAFLEKADRIVRATYSARMGGSVNHTARSAPPLGPALEETFPEVRESVRFVADLFAGQDGHSVVQIEQRSFLASGFYFADPAVFEVFTIPFLTGDPETALAEPGSVVLTASEARRYFGKEDPMGHQIEFGDRYELRVTGVIADVPPETHLPYEALISIETDDRPLELPAALTH